MPNRFNLTLSAFDKALNKKASPYYGLSIQVSQGGFSFCIFDPQSKKYLGIESYDFQYVSNNNQLFDVLEKLIPGIEWLSLPFESVKIIFETHKSTLVPQVLFDNEKPQSHIELNHPVETGEAPQNDFLTTLDARNVWLIPENIRKLLRRYFPLAPIHHHGSVLIERLRSINKNVTENQGVFVYVRKNMFDIVVLINNKLLFFNSFSYQAKEDFIYFLIYVLEQLELNPESVRLTFLGEILKLSSIYDIAHKYVRHVGFGSRSLDYNYSYVFDDIPGHFYFNLLNLNRCEL